MSTRSEYQKAMQENLTAWRKRLDTLGDKSTTEVKAKLMKDLEEWKQEGNRAAIKLEELRSAGGESWESIRVEMDNMWQRIDASLAKGEAHRVAQERDDKPSETRSTLVLVPSLQPGRTPAGRPSKNN